MRRHVTTRPPLPSTVRRGTIGRRRAHMRAALADEELEAVRRRGFGVAYRMLGTVADAEDVAQEELLRLTRSEQRIEEPAAWITTVATRLSIDALRLARTRREKYVGPWLPEPLIDHVAADVGAHSEL